MAAGLVAHDSQGLISSPPTRHPWLSSVEAWTGPAKNHPLRNFVRFGQGLRDPAQGPKASGSWSRWAPTPERRSQKGLDHTGW